MAKSTAAAGSDYDALLASEAWQASLADLNRALADCLEAAGAEPVLNGNLFYGHLQPGFGTAPLEAEMDAKRRTLFEVARRGETLFEIGVNGGHSLLLARSSNPALRCVGVDIARQVDPTWARVDIYVPVAMAWLTERFPGAFRFIVGDSRLECPRFAVENGGERIDILHVDGAKETYFRDIVNLWPLLHRDSLIVVDDISTSHREAYHYTVAEGLLVGLYAVVRRWEWGKADEVWGPYVAPDDDAFVERVLAWARLTEQEKRTEQERGRTFVSKRYGLQATARALCAVLPNLTAPTGDPDTERKVFFLTHARRESLASVVKDALQRSGEAASAQTLMVVGLPEGQPTLRRVVDGTPVIAIASSLLEDAAIEVLDWWRPGLAIVDRELASIAALCAGKAVPWVLGPDNVAELIRNGARGPLTASDAAPFYRVGDGARLVAITPPTQE